MIWCVEQDKTIIITSNLSDQLFLGPACDTRHMSQDISQCSGLISLHNGSRWRMIMCPYRAPGRPRLYVDDTLHVLACYGVFKEIYVIAST